MKGRRVAIKRKKNNTQISRKRTKGRDLNKGTGPKTPNGHDQQGEQREPKGKRSVTKEAFSQAR